MNRILKRPMFRMGGAAEGITSGLDRQNYKNGGDSQIKADAQRIFNLSQELAKENELERGRGMPGSLASFLIPFGLNLASATPRGNIIATAVESAKDPFNRFQAARFAEEQDEKRRMRDALDTAVSSAVDLERERIEAGPTGTAGRDPYKFEVELTKLEQYITQNNELKQRNELLTEKLQGIGTSLADETTPQSEIDKDKKRIQDEIDDNNRMISTNERLLQKIEGRNDLSLDEARAIIEAYGVDSPEYAEYKKTGKIPVAQKDGGRIEKNMGGSITGGAEDVDEVEELSFTELRARLPNEISNDIVRLLSNSKQALLSFANIQTQEDVNQFNQQYNVNLTLPSEA